MAGVYGGCGVIGREVQTTDLRAFVWRSLRRFRNVSFVTDEILSRHSLSAAQKRNARKQAEQISVCLSLAEEYFEASKVSTLATKPVLLYYSLMNFALAQVLITQDGDSNLDRARAKHSHHGMETSFSVPWRSGDSFTEVATRLKARPHEVSGERRGTFALWHKTASEYPLIGKVSNNIDNTIGADTVLRPNSSGLHEVPADGLNVLQAIQCIPTMESQLQMLELPSSFARATFSQEVRPKSTQLFVVVHPGDVGVIESVKEKISCSSNLHEELRYKDFACGFSAAWTFYLGSDFGLNFPSGVSLSASDCRLYAGSPFLNEFGGFYWAFYILGNLCRYYPHVWIAEVRDSTSLAILTESLCEEFSSRVPQLVNAVLTRQFLVAR